MTIPEFGQGVTAAASKLAAKPRSLFRPKTLSSLKVISIQSENADNTCRQITQYLGEQLGIETEFIDNIPWQEREHLLDTQEAHLGWICGLPYIWKADQEHPHVELVAAPVMQNPRYQQQPIYYSDVIVHKDSDYYRFDDLRGLLGRIMSPTLNPDTISPATTWRSGVNIKVTLDARLKRGLANSLEMVLDHHIAASAIDSTVLETELAARPDLKEKVRVIETFRPSPMPPWVVTKNVPPALREAIRKVFWHMYKTDEGQKILTQGQIQRLVRVEDHDYDPIRDMAQLADQVVW